MNDRDALATKGEVSKDTRTTLGTAAIVALGLFFAWKDLNAQGIENRHQVEMLQVETRALRVLIEAQTVDRWTRTNERLWQDAFKARNPELDFPPFPESP